MDVAFDRASAALLVDSLEKTYADGTVALASRETRRVVALWTQTILPPAVTALLFLAVFGGALGPRIGDVDGIAYAAFLLPGLLVLTVVGPAVSDWHPAPRVRRGRGSRG